MPTYEYRCENCGAEFERFQSISARPLRKCPHCGKTGLRRLIGVGAGIIFKGPGFYETDYRSDSYKEAEKKDKPAADTTKKETKAETKDSKSEEKPKSDTKTKKKSA